MTGKKDQEFGFGYAESEMSSRFQEKIQTVEYMSLEFRKDMWVKIKMSMETLDNTKYLNEI